MSSFGRMPGHGLRTVGPQWFVVAMGLAGLALAWHRAGPAFGPAADGLALALAAAAAGVFAMVVAAIGLRLRRHPKALREDFAHPVRHGFVAALPVSVLLLATLAQGLGAPQPWVAPAWLAGAAFQAAATVWVLRRIVFQGLKWPAVTPVLFIPVVGNIVVPLAGPGFGFPSVSWAFFGIGAFFWPLVTVLVLARTAQQALPDRLLPAWFLSIAPPAALGLAAIALGLPAGVAWAALGIALIFLGVSLGVLRRLGSIEFGLGHWAASFPLAALAALALRLADGSAFGGALAMVLLVIASLAIFFLSLATWRGLRSGSLLSPEPVAAIRPVTLDSRGAKT